MPFNNAGLAAISPCRQRDTKVWSSLKTWAHHVPLGCAWRLIPPRRICPTLWADCAAFWGWNKLNVSLGQGICCYVSTVLMLHHLSLRLLPVLGDVSEVLWKPLLFTLALFASHLRISTSFSHATKGYTVSNWEQPECSFPFFAQNFHLQAQISTSVPIKALLQVN